MSALEVCVCGFEAPAIDGPRHSYFNNTGGCWAAFGEVIAREYTTPALFEVHTLNVDTYAAQHPGGAHPDKSVAIHLVGLYLALERGVPATEVPRNHKRLADSLRTWPHFEPPAQLGRVRAIDVARARTAESHLAASRAWARSVWDAWSAQDAAVIEFARASGHETAREAPSRLAGRRR